MVAAAGVVANEPRVGLGLECRRRAARPPGRWRMVPNRRRWKAGRQHSCRAVPWNRSHTALWFGLRAGIAWCASPTTARCLPEALVVLGTVVAEDSADGPAEPPPAAPDLIDEPDGVLGGDRAEHDVDHGPAGGGVDG